MSGVILLSVLPVLLLIIGSTAQSIRVAKTTKCPGREYYYMIMVGVDEEAICYLCFCKSNITNSICFKRSLDSCRIDTNEYKNNQSKTTGLGRSSAAREAFRKMIFNFDFMNEDYCIPHVSGYTNCTNGNICSGCSKCQCNEHGAWDCILINDCASNDSFPETLAKPQTIEFGSNSLVGEETTEDSKRKLLFPQVHWKNKRAKRELGGSLVDDIRLASEDRLTNKSNDLPPYLSDEEIERLRLTSGIVNISSVRHENKTSNSKEAFQMRPNTTINFCSYNAANQSTGESPAQIILGKKHVNSALLEQQMQDYTESDKYGDINMGTNKSKRIDNNPTRNKSEGSQVEFTAYSDVRNRTLEMFKNGTAIGKTSDTLKLEINNTSNDSITYSNTSISQVMHQSRSKILPKTDNSSLDNGFVHETFVSVLKKVLIPFSETQKNVSKNNSANLYPRDKKITFEDNQIQNAQKIFATYEKTQDKLKKNLDVKQKVIKLIKLCINNAQCMIGDDTSLKIILLLGQFRQDVFDSLLLDKQIQRHMLNFLIGEPGHSTEIGNNPNSRRAKIKLLSSRSEKGESIEIENVKYLNQLTAMLRAYARCINGLSDTLDEIFSILVNETSLDIRSTLIDRKPLIIPTNSKRPIIYCKTLNHDNLKKYALIKMVKSLDYLKKVRQFSLSRQLIDNYLKSNEFKQRFCKECKNNCCNDEFKQSYIDKNGLIDRVNHTIQPLFDLHRLIIENEPKHIKSKQSSSIGEDKDIKGTSKKYMFFNNEDSLNNDFEENRQITKPTFGKKQITDLIYKHKGNTKTAKTDNISKTTLFPKIKGQIRKLTGVFDIDDQLNNTDTFNYIKEPAKLSEAIKDFIFSRLNLRMNGSNESVDCSKGKKVNKLVIPYLNKKEPLLMNKNSSKFKPKESSHQHKGTDVKDHFIELDFISKPDDEFDLRDQIRDPAIVSETDNKFPYIDKYRVSGSGVQSKDYISTQSKEEKKNDNLGNETFNKDKKCNLTAENDPKYKNYIKLGKIIEVMKCLKNTSFVPKPIDETKQFFRETQDELIFNLDLNAKDAKFFENCLNLATKIKRNDDLNMTESDNYNGRHSNPNSPRSKRSIYSSNRQSDELTLKTKLQNLVDNSEILAIDYMLALLEAILRKSRIGDDHKGKIPNRLTDKRNFNYYGVEKDKSRYDTKLPFFGTIPITHPRTLIQDPIPNEPLLTMEHNLNSGEIETNIPESIFYVEDDSTVPSSIPVPESLSLNRIDGLEVPFDMSLVRERSNKKTTKAVKKEAHKNVMNALHHSRYKQIKKFGRLQMNRLFYSTKTLPLSPMDLTTSSEKDSQAKDVSKCICTDSIQNEEKNNTFGVKIVKDSEQNISANHGNFTPELPNHKINSFNTYTYIPVTDKNRTTSAKYMVKYINNKKYMNRNNHKGIISNKLNQSNFEDFSKTTSLPGPHNIVFSTHKSVNEDELMIRKVFSKLGIETQKKMKQMNSVLKKTLKSRIKTHNDKKNPSKGPGTPSFQSMQVSNITSELERVSETVPIKHFRKSGNDLKVDQTSSSKLLTEFETTTFRADEGSNFEYQFSRRLTNSSDLNNVTQKKSYRFTQHLPNNESNVRDLEKNEQFEIIRSSEENEALLNYSAVTTAFDLNTSTVTEKMELVFDENKKSSINNFNDSEHLQLRKNINNSDAISFATNITFNAKLTNEPLKPVEIADSGESKRHIVNKSDGIHFNSSNVVFNMKESIEEGKEAADKLLDPFMAIKVNGTLIDLQESSSSRLEDFERSTITEKIESEMKMSPRTDDNSLQNNKENIIQHTHSLLLTENPMNSNIPSSYIEQNLDLLDLMQDNNDNESTTEGDITTHFSLVTFSNNFEKFGTEKGENSTKRNTTENKTFKIDTIDENFEDMKEKQNDNFLKYLDYNEDFSEKPLPDADKNNVVYV